MSEKKLNRILRRLSKIKNIAIEELNDYYEEVYISCDTSIKTIDKITRFCKKHKLTISKMEVCDTTLYVDIAYNLRG